MIQDDTLQTHRMRQLLTFWLNRIAFAVYLPLKALLFTMKKYLLATFLILLVALAASAAYVYPKTLGKLPNAETVKLVVPKGASYHQVADSLVAAEVLGEKRWFLLLGRLTGADKKMRAGRFDIPPGLSTKDLVQHLNDAPLSQIKVTLPEGILASRMAAAFERKLGADSSLFMKFVHDTAFAQTLVPGAKSLEGYLLPETYLFQWKTPEKELVKFLVNQTLAIFAPDSISKRLTEMDMTQLEILTLASIVEGEALVDAERPIISSLYHNRLRLKWPLQADPTIQFILPGPPRRLLNKHLKIDSPYNTYKYGGLPPGPVNNPGKNSILATLYPDSTPYLYMVASGDGGHKFSKTLREHNYWHAKFNEVRRRYRREQRRQQN